MTEPLFRNAHDALVFAYNYSNQQYGKTPMSRIAAPESRTGKGLSGVDGAAQAGFIRREVHSLGNIPEAVLIARFAPRTADCSCKRPCCIGQMPNGEWTGAISTLEQHLKDVVMKGCFTTWDMRMQYVMRQFLKKGDRLGLEEIASRNSITRQTVSSHNAMVKIFFAGQHVMDGSKKKKMPGMEEIAFNEIERRLVDIGMVIC